MRAVLFEFVFRQAKGQAVRDQRIECFDDGGQVLPAGDIDLVRDTLRIPVHVRIFAGIDERLSTGQ